MTDLMDAIDNQLGDTKGLLATARLEAEHEALIQEENATGEKP